MLVFRAVPISGQQLGSADRSALADTVSSIINVGEPFKLAHCLAVILPAVELPAMPCTCQQRQFWHTASHLVPFERLH